METGRPSKNGADWLRSFFVRAPNWQIFLLVFGLYFGSSVGFLFWNLPAAHSEKLLDVPELLSGIIVALGVVPFFLWFWAMGSFLNTAVSVEHRPRMRFFGFALVYPLFYFVLFFASFEVASPMLWTVIFPLHMLAMVCMFYLLYFVSKSLALVELARSVSFYDYAGPFFLLWFFPIGIWIIQPRLNRIYAEQVPKLGRLPAPNTTPSAC